ncbi:MAG: hypothetical protein DRH24_19285 [Deltaproteobacteria bacterium]|nr:MAG: hypothetical protein DRH24_19285 [Deltaproteobacteria bacterium]
MGNRFGILVHRIPDGLKVAFLSTTLVAFSFYLQADISIGLLDEGWLWYGTWRTGLGEIPVLDFFSYDPGRYYWTAGWSMVFGNGIMGLRASVALFQVIGLTFGLLTLRRMINSWWLLGLMGALLMVWMYPGCKVFDHCIPLAGIYFAVLLMEKPSILRHFLCGVFVGAAAFFGRNHGVYGLISFFFLIVFVRIRIEKSDLVRRMAAWGLGIVIGYCPMVFMWVRVDGFFESIIDSIMLLFRLKSTNLPLPVPWPWTGDWAQMNFMEGAGRISTGLLFILLPLFYLLTALDLIWPERDALRQKAILIAALFVGLPYVHYAFSRADISHLALGIHPFLVGMISLPFVLKPAYKRVIGGGFLSLVFVMSFFSVVVCSPFYLKASASEGAFVKVDILGDAVWLNPYKAHLFRTLEKIHEKKIGPEENLLIAPHWTVFYPVFEKASPLRELFFLVPEREDRQKEMISELKKKNVHWVILGDVAFDGRQDLRFRNTHHLLWKHIMDHFESVKAEGLPGNYRLLKRKQGV